MRFFAVATAFMLAMANSQIRGQEPARRESSKDETAEVAKLVGTYRITTGERNGKKIDADKLADVTVRIEKKVITTFDKDKKEFYAAAYELDTKQKPWKIMMTATIVPVADKNAKTDGKGNKAEGLIEISGETVKLIYSLPEGNAPTEFKAGEKQQMFVLIKMEKQQGQTLEQPEKPR